MPKLSKEAWTAAFFDVMKEPMPPSKSSLKRVGAHLATQKDEAETALSAAHRKSEHASAVAEDDERKRYGAGVEYDEVMRRTLTEEGRRSAKQDYDAAAERARASAELAKQARIEHKEQAFRLKQLQAQVADVASRASSGDLGGLSPELEQALKHAQLEKRLEAEDAILADYDERMRLREEELQAARRNLNAGEASILEGDVAAFKERIEGAQAKRDAIAALLPGFSLDAAVPSNTDKLADSVVRMKGAAKASDAALAAESVKREAGERGQKAKDGELEAAAGRDPALKVAFDLLAGKRAALAEIDEAVVLDKASLAKSEANYRSWQLVLDAYASGRDPQPEPQQVSDALKMTTNRVGSLARDKADLRNRQEALRLAAAEVATAKSALTEAVAARLKTAPPDGELAVAQKALADAEAALKRAAQAEKDAKDASTQVRQMADEAARRLKHAQTLPAATATVGEFNEALKGVEDVPIWDGSAALLKQLGQARFNHLRDLANKLAGEYETLTANGATMEELQAIYKDTPDLWKPPRFREEEKNWVAMKDLVDEEAEDKHRKESETRLAAVDKKIEAFKSKLETGETVAKVLGKGMEKAAMLEGLGSDTLKAIGERLSENKELAEKAETVLGLAAKLASVVQAPLKAIDSAQQAMETEDPVEMLMLQDEFMASLGDLVGGLTASIKGLDTLKVGGALVSQMASLLPGIGVATSAAEAMKGLVDSAARIQEAMEDAETHALAKEGAHRGETAIDQFARRDTHLAARASAKTGVAVIKTAAAAVDLTGVGLPASTALKGVATGVSAVQTVLETVIDRGEGEKAQQLLDRAQAGDGHARSELFRYHPRYAKGILAIMASEGDALALRVLSTHGLDESMIRRSSPKIIKRYLLKKFGESDTPPSWTSARESLSAGIASVGALFQRIDDFFGNVADKLLVRFDSNNLVVAQAGLSDLAYQLSSQSDVSAAVSALVELRLRRETLAKSADPEQAEDLAAADKALEAELKKVEKVRTHVLESMGRVNEVMASIGQQPASPLRSKAEAAAKAVLREHLVRVQSLASAG